MKRKMKTMNNQVTRLRDEITGKELALAKDQQEHKRLEKDNEALKVQQLVSLVLCMVLSSSSSLDCYLALYTLIKASAK